MKHRAEAPLWLRRVTKFAWIALACVGFAAVAVGIEALSTLRIDRYPSLTGPERLAAIDAARAAQMKYLGGLGVVGGLLYTARTYRLNQRAQQSEQLLATIQRISEATKPASRAASLFALWDLANAERPGRHWELVETVLVGIIREDRVPAQKAGVDVLTALDLLARRPPHRSGATSAALDLREARLEGVVMPNPLRRAIFDSSCLAGARFIDVDLTGARFVNSCLEGADFSGATLTGVRFDRALLREVKVDEASLIDVVLSEADTAESPELEQYRVSNPYVTPLESGPRICSHT